MSDNRTVYFNNTFMPKKRVHISPDDRGFLFADGVYEVIRAYNGTLFQLEAHFKRLERSLDELSLNFTDLEGLKKACHRLIRENSLENRDALLYIQITRGVAERTHTFPAPEVPVTVYASASAFQADPEKQKNGVSVIIRPDIRWNRCDIKTISLLPNVMACEGAHQQGHYETVMVRNGAVTEGTRTNFCAVFNDVLYTHPESNNILSGVTRKVVLELCREKGIAVNETPVLESRLANADEMFLVGTTPEIMPIVRFNGSSVKNGLPGPVTMKLQRAFKRRVN
ncbi:MAG: D-amino-acid transaminase [Desulfobacteraceae bacterium]